MAYVRKNDRVFYQEVVELDQDNLPVTVDGFLQLHILDKHTGSSICGYRGNMRNRQQKEKKVFPCRDCCEGYANSSDTVSDVQYSLF